MSGHEDHVMSRSTIRSSLAVCGVLATLATVTAGCKQPVMCEPLDDCGGAIPVGDWVLATGTSSCTEEIYVAPPDPRLIQADIPVARLPPPEPALFDWCELLVTGPGDDIVTRAPPYLYTGVAPIGRVALHYEADGRYRLSTTRAGLYSIDYPWYCMRAFGGADKLAADGVTTITVCEQLTKGLTAKVAKKYKNISCVPNGIDPPAQTGCICSFDLQEVQESVGFYGATSARKIQHLPGNNFPQVATYCAQGNRLQLTGTDGAYLFDRVGLRTLDLVQTAANCEDGMQGPGEDGLDCGPGCDIMCSAINCNDLMQGPGEDGVDCGRRCGKVCAAAP
jgi:hypothetical protein